MAKKSSTIHVEGFVWKCIEEYQALNDITSRNTAIECMISEYKALKELSIKSSEIEHIEINKEPTEIEEPRKENPMYSKLQSMEDDMPD